MTAGLPPRLSVIVPVHDAATMLDRCLGALARSEFRDFECIVVDDQSTDESRAVALRHAARLVALDRRGGPARARNRGAAGARGEIVVFIDADVAVHPDTLSRFDAHLRRHPEAAAVMGSYDDAPADGRLVSQYKNLLHHYVHQHSRPEAWTFWAGCGAVRRRVFDEIGGFDEAYGRPCVEDIELGLRLRERGHRIDLDRAIQATHLKRWTLVGLLRSDVLDRGIPWFRLMLQHRTMPSDLNVRVVDRVSVVLAYALALAAGLVGIGSPAARPALLGVLAVVALVLFALHYDLYRFFAQKRGLPFAAAVIPLHWLYYLYCGVAVGAGYGLHVARDRPAAGRAGT